MKGLTKYAKPIYHRVASILGKKQFELYGTNSFLGRWLESKNTMEQIGGNLFVHSGISPELERNDLNLKNYTK